MVNKYLTNKLPVSSVTTRIHTPKGKMVKEIFDQQSFIGLYHLYRKTGNINIQTKGAKFPFPDYRQ